MVVEGLFEKIYGFKHSFETQSTESEPVPFHTTLITYGDSFGKIKDIPKLNYFDSVHILPFFPQTSDGGFSISDYTSVRSELGDWSAITTISKTKTVMADLVLNHVSSQHKWFLSVIELGEESPYYNFFHIFDKPPDTHSVYRPRVSPLFTKFSTASGPKYVWTTFGPDQIDLNFSNPLVFFELLETIKLFLDKGIRIIRLDAVGYIWKELGTSCFNHENVYYFVELLRKYIRTIDTHAVVVAEIHDKIEVANSYLPVCDMVYDFRPASAILYALKHGESLELYKIQSTPNHFAVICTHDGTSLNGSHLHADQKETILMGCIGMRKTATGNIPYEMTSSSRTLAGDGFYRAHAYLLFCFERVGVYYRNLFDVGDNVELQAKTQHNRDMNRGDVIGVKVDTRLENLIKLRSKQPILESGSVLHVKVAKQVFACERALGENRVLVMINLGENITLSKYKGLLDLSTNERFTGELTEYAILVLDE